MHSTEPSSFTTAGPHYRTPQRVGFFLWIVRPLTHAWDIFLRRDFGHRYFNPVRAVVVLLWFWVVYAFLVEMVYGPPGPLCGPFVWAFHAMLVWQVWQALNRNRCGWHVHSRFSGRSLDVFRRLPVGPRLSRLSSPDILIRLRLEPLFAALVSVAVSFVDDALAAYLAITGFFWAAKSRAECQLFKHTIMDAHDARLFGYSVHQASGHVRTQQEARPRAVSKALQAQRSSRRWQVAAKQTTPGSVLAEAERLIDRRVEKGAETTESETGSESESPQLQWRRGSRKVSRRWDLGSGS